MQKESILDYTIEMGTINMKRDDYINELKKIDFFKENIHPEYLPFVGEGYCKYRILHVGESHYIGNYHKDHEEKNGKIMKENSIMLQDYQGWWDGKQSAKLSELAYGWYNTSNIVNWYMSCERHKGHGIFTNVLKSFCNVVATNEAFNRITTDDSKRYNYFAYMNFYQMPSIYYGENYTKALYAAGKLANYSTESIDEIWYECMEKSSKVFEDVVNALDPVCIVVSSREVEKYYSKYGSKNSGGTYSAGKLCNDPRMIYVDHPGSSWWNRRKKNVQETSKEHLESRLKEIYYKTNM